MPSIAGGNEAFEISATVEVSPKSNEADPSRGFAMHRGALREELMEGSPRSVSEELGGAGRMSRLTIAIAMVALSAPGCFLSRAKVEAPLDAEKINEIVVGRSTKEDVVRTLGAPTDILFSNRQLDPLRVFAYEYTYTVTKTSGLTLLIITFLNSDAKRDHVLVFFDDDGVVSAVGSSLNADQASYELPFGD